MRRLESCKLSYGALGFVKRDQNQEPSKKTPKPGAKRARKQCIAGKQGFAKGKANVCCQSCHSEHIEFPFFVC